MNVSKKLLLTGFITSLVFLFIAACIFVFRWNHFLYFVAIPSWSNFKGMFISQVDPSDQQLPFEVYIFFSRTMTYSSYYFWFLYFLLILNSLYSFIIFKVFKKKYLVKLFIFIVLMTGIYPFSMFLVFLISAGLGLVG